MSLLFSRLTAAFPLWILLCSGLALVRPEWFTWFSGSYIVWGLALIMLGMGITLSFADFKGVVTMPRAGFIGLGCQFVIMPLLGWGIGILLRLSEIDPSLAAGLILVACCPGGTASNVVTYLAKANVALSVLRRRDDDLHRVLNRARGCPVFVDGRLGDQLSLLFAV